MRAVVVGVGVHVGCKRVRDAGIRSGSLRLYVRAVPDNAHLIVSSPRRFVVGAAATLDSVLG